MALRRVRDERNDMNDFDAYQALSSQDVLERTVDAHVMNLRRRIEPDPAKPKRIVTVFGVGYRFEGIACD